MKQLSAHKVMALRNAMKGKRGVVMWRGPSLYNGKPIKVVMRLDGNAKTGTMHTVYIVPDIDKSYVDCRRDGDDISNCGDCDLAGQWSNKLQRVTDRLCYVSGQGLDMIYKSELRGNYPDLDWVARTSGLDFRDVLRQLSGPDQPTRLGGWGDAAFVPAQVWRDAGMHDKRWLTNYTHQWRWLGNRLNTDHDVGDHHDYMRSISMASCHSPQCVRDADKLGWRKFITVPTLDAVIDAVYPDRTSEPDMYKRLARSIIKRTITRLKQGDDSPTPRLTLCAADKSHLRPLQCDVCPIMCDGRNERNPMRTADVWIHIHGAPSVIGAWKRSPHWQSWLKEFQITRNITKEQVA